MATTARTVERLVRLLGPGARTRPMMGEYVLYWRERVVGGVYDDRLLLKDVPATRQAHPDAPLEEPYPGDTVGGAQAYLDLLNFIAGDPEEVVLQDVHAREEVVQVLADDHLSTTFNTN